MNDPLASHIDGYIAHLQGKGFGGNVVRDLPAQLSPPEVAAWTGKKYRMSLRRSGTDTWLELTTFTEGMGWSPLLQIRNMANINPEVLAFVQRDGE